MGEEFGEIPQDLGANCPWDGIPVPYNICHSERRAGFPRPWTADELPEIEMLKKIMLQNKKIINQNKIIIDLLKKQGENND